MEFDFKKANLIIKTLEGYEKVVAEILKDRFPNINVLPKPLNYTGLVLAIARHPEIYEKIKHEVPEAEKVFLVSAYTRADPEAIKSASISLLEKLKDAKSFAVKTTRRGKHTFSSMDINILVGAVIKERTNLQVNLDFPEKVIFVEIMNEHAYIGLADGKDFPKKKKKFLVRNYFEKISLVQMPYLGSVEVAREMGSRIGREAQTFEVGELVIAPVGKVNGKELNAFLDGVFVGINSRYCIQKRVYPFRPREVEVNVQNLYELVRERSDEPIVVFEPEGKTLTEVSSELAYRVIKNKRTSFLIGARRGIPSGIYRFADMVVDLCPGVTISTDLAAASALIGLTFALEENVEKSDRST